MTCLRRVIQAVIAAMTTRISSTCHLETAEPDFAVAKTERCQVVPETKIAICSDTLPTTTTHNEPATPCAQPFDVKSQILNERESNVKVN